MFPPERLGRRGLAALAASALVALILGFWGLTRPNDNLPSSLAYRPPSAPGEAQASAPDPHGAPGASTAVKLGPPLSQTSYIAAAYQIYPGPLDANARRALAGFTASFDPGSQGVTMTISAVGSGQPPLRRTFDSSDKVYFVETRWGDDDVRSNAEFNFGDDGLILTNADGRIILSQ